MSDRDELAELIWQHTDGTDENAPDIAADKIIAAGWAKSGNTDRLARIITSPEYGERVSRIPPSFAYPAGTVHEPV